MRRLLYLVMVFVALVSCTGGKVYDHYNHTPLSGWDKVDELSYDVPALKDSGRYVTTLGLRINPTYPFLSLTMIVEQKVIHKSVQKTKKSKYPSDIYRDTLNCELFDDNGSIRGNGVNYYQYNFRVSELELHEGDSLHVIVTHDMRREIIPGISDVGISITKQK